MADFAATAYPAQCAVVVAWNEVAAAGTAPAFMCTVLEHEFGHLSGLGHSPDSNNVMFAIVWKAAPDCSAAFPGHAKLQSAGIQHTSRGRARRVGAAARSTSARASTNARHSS
jgi:Matrixin